MDIFLAHVEQLEALSILFNQYRIFYNQVSDLHAAKQFLKDRLNHRDSVIFVAEKEQMLVGFVQLYPSFSSVSMKQVWILNDLFVTEHARRQGVAKLLIAAAEQYATESGVVRIALATQITNLAAQKLYESRNYVKDEVFYHYTLPLG